jgi:antirestriction protein
MNTTTTTTALDEPAIWLGCLSCYNNGRLNGKWITAEQAAEPEAAKTLNGLATLKTVGSYIASRCRKCFGDEFDVMDYQLIPKSCATAKEFYKNAEQLAELHNDDKLGLLVILAGALDPAGLMSLDELAEYHENCYYGEHDTDTAFAEHYADEVGDTASVPEHMRNYIDYEYYARELLYDFMSEAGHYWRNS